MTSDWSGVRTTAAPFSRRGFILGAAAAALSPSPASANVPVAYDWDAAPGKHRISVRATDGTGAVQTAERRSPRPSGATGYQSITVNVR